MKKIYLFAAAMGAASLSFAQSLEQGNIPKARGLEKSELKQRVGGLSVSTRPAQKAAGDVYFSEDFSNGFVGSSNGPWTLDMANQPDTVNDAFQWEEDTLRKAGLNVPDFASASAANGYAAFNPRFIRQGLGFSFASQPCWAGLKSPVIDLSQVPAAEVGALQISFASYMAHCCDLSFSANIDISFDGGTTFNLTDRINVTEVTRNIRTAEDNVTIVAIGLLLDGQPDLSQVVLRWTWDSVIPDVNNQTSTEYYWCIDDIEIAVAPDYDFSMTDAYYGDTFYDFDYRQLPEPMIKDYPMSAEVTNNGAKTGLVKIGVSLENPTLGITKTYESQEIALAGFSDSTVVFPVFTDYSENEDWVGGWNITYYTIVNGANPDVSTDANDTAQAPFITVTDSIWAHARSWLGNAVVTNPQNGSGALLGMEVGQTIKVPNNLNSVDIVGMRVSMLDSIEDTPITVPNTIDFRIQRLNDVPPNFPNRRNGVDDNFLGIYYNESEGEVDGQINITPANRERRITAGDATEPTFVYGDVFDLATSTQRKLTLSSDEFYFISFNPIAPMNLVAEGDHDDNSLWIYGEFGGSGEAWYTTTDQAPYLDLIVKAKAVGIAENDELGFSLGQNMPNPFQGTSHIDYELEKTAEVSFSIIDLTGKKVMNKELGTLATGKHRVSISADALNNGIYFYTLTVDGKSLTKKMIVTK